MIAPADEHRIVIRSQGPIPSEIWQLLVEWFGGDDSEDDYEEQEPTS